MSRILTSLALLIIGLSSVQAATKKKKPSAPAAPVVKTTHVSSTVARRNVLLILVDDLNADVGWLGGPVPTPHMDRLAMQGMRFTNAHAPHALSHASRVAIFTGLLPSTSGVYTAELDWRRSIQLKGRITMPEFLLGAGHTTAAAGSIFVPSHFGEVNLESDSLWEARLPGISAASVKHVNGLDLWDWGMLKEDDEQTLDGKSVAWAAEYLEQPKGKKLFFLTVALDKPHVPWYAPSPYYEVVTGDAAKVPETRDDDFQDIPDYAKEDFIAADSTHSLILSAKAWPDAVRAYRACVAFADAQVGRIMEALEKSPYAKNTIVCLVSTRGMALGDKRCWQSGSLWACSTHVPLTILDPGVTHPGSVSDEPVSTLDLFPTLAELTRQDIPKGLDGTSLAPLLLDPEAHRTKPAITVMGGGDQASYAVRTLGWAYLRNADGSEELYDRAADPHEWTNLAGKAEHEETQKVLSQFVPKEWHSAERSTAQLGKTGADGAEVYELQGGDRLVGKLAPTLAQRGIDVELTLKVSGREDVMLVSQGDAQNGWALHLVAGKPTATLFNRGRATTLSTAEPSAGMVRVRLFIPGNGTMSLGVSGQSQITGQCPFVGGFPEQPAGDLTVGEAFGPLTESKPFEGTLDHVWLTLLPP